jgi:hypothetical protein
MNDSEKIRIAIISFLAGVILAFLLFPKQELETVYKTKTEVKTDTIYSRYTDTVYIPKTKIKTEFLGIQY